jgi:predicted nucleic acid-binding protein
MKIYWDAGALMKYILARRQAEIAGVTRVHTLAELFSALTGSGWNETLPGGLQRRRKMGLLRAAERIREIRPQLEFIELTADETVSALQSAKASGAGGGRIHDLLHAFAAQKAHADELWTSDENDFAGLGPVPVKLI